MAFEKAKKILMDSYKGKTFNRIFKTKFRCSEYNDKYKIEIFAHVYKFGGHENGYYRFVLSYKNNGVWYPACNEVTMDSPERVALQYLWTIQNYMLNYDVGDGPENEAWKPNAVPKH